MNYWDTVYQDAQTKDFQAGDGWLSAFSALLPRGAHALDLGCGSGANIPDLLAMGLSVTAADLSPDALRALGGRFSQVETVCLDMANPLPFADCAFDAVAADLSLHYFPWKTTRSIVREIRRILTPGGALIARVHSADQISPAGLKLIEPDYYIVGGLPRRYFREEHLRALFEDGFELTLARRQIERFGMIKQVFEFTAVKKP